MLVLDRISVRIQSRVLFLMVPGDIISYIDLCLEEKCNLQRGMNFHLHGGHSVILMSVRPGAPYDDSLSDDGKTLIYEGHDISKTKNGIMDPKSVDQEEFLPSGHPTQNGLFHQAAQKSKKSGEFDKVRVYEKIKPGIWVYNGYFNLIDSKFVSSNGRKVFKFYLSLTDEHHLGTGDSSMVHDRIIPSHVKLEVWQRDKAKCIQCGSIDNLHFDHIIPYSKGGSSKVASNIQLLCARHNLSKRDKIV